MPQIFEQKANNVPTLLLIAVLVGGLFTIGFVWYYFSPRFYEVGYAPEQPVPYSHRLHAGQLGMDCQYCHTHVAQSEHANVPPTQTCMNCHSQIKQGSNKLVLVRESWATGDPVEWVNVHHVADYAHFPHAAHVNVGVGCETCHGRVDHMEIVYVAQPLSMGWCLQCHRNPEQYLRDPSLVTQMGHDDLLKADPAKYATQVETNLARIAAEGIQPPQNCSACHY